MAKLIILFLILSIQAAFPQEYVNLFQNELTDRIRFEGFSKEMVNKDLEMAAKIHPELFYYYITFNNGKYDGKVETDFRLQSEQLGQARSNYISRKNLWFTSIEKRIREKEADVNLRNRSSEYLSKHNSFRGLTITSLCESCYKTDLNKRDYLVYKFYLKDKDMVYLPNEDYGALKSRYEKEFIEKLKKDYEYLSTGSHSPENAEDDMSQIMNHWYLFSGDKELLSADFIRSFSAGYKSDGTRENKDKLSITVNYNNFIFGPLNHSFASGAYYKAKGENSFDISAKQIYIGLNYILGLNYTFRLSPAGGLLSSLSLEAGYSRNVSEERLTFTYPSQIPQYNGADYRLSYNFKINCEASLNYYVAGISYYIF